MKVQGFSFATELLVFGLRLRGRFRGGLADRAMGSQVVFGREHLAASGTVDGSLGGGVVRRGRGGKRNGVFNGRSTKGMMTNRLWENRHRLSAVMLMLLLLMMLWLMLMSGEGVSCIFRGRWRRRRRRWRRR